MLLETVCVLGGLVSAGRIPGAAEPGAISALLIDALVQFEVTGRLLYAKVRRYRVTMSMSQLLCHRTSRCDFGIDLVPSLAIAHRTVTPIATDHRTGESRTSGADQSGRGSASC